MLLSHECISSFWSTYYGDFYQMYKNNNNLTIYSPLLAIGSPSIKVKTTLRLPQTKRTYYTLDIANATSLPISSPRLLHQHKTLDKI
jgi:hypothetical protein